MLSLFLPQAAWLLIREVPELRTHYWQDREEKKKAQQPAGFEPMTSRVVHHRRVLYRSVTTTCPTHGYYIIQWGTTNTLSSSQLRLWLGHSPALNLLLVFQKLFVFELFLFPSSRAFLCLVLKQETIAPIEKLRPPHRFEFKTRKGILPSSKVCSLTSV